MLDVPEHEQKSRMIQEIPPNGERCKFSEINENYSRSSFKSMNNLRINLEEFEKKYNRMEEYYRTQISRLKEETLHYKELYNKLLAQNKAEQRLSRTDI